VSLDARQLPIQHVTRRTRFMTGAQLLGRTQFLDQLAHRLGAVGDHTQDAHFAILFGDRDGNRLGMDIQT
jgi:hypothetical protein